MRRSTITFAVLLVLLFVVVSTISFIVASMCYYEKDWEEVDSHHAGVSEIGMVGEMEKTSHGIISSRFHGNYERDGQSVILSEDGNYYVVTSGYVLTNGVRIDAREEDSITVYDLK